MKSPLDELGQDEDAAAVDAVHAAMDKALGWAESRDSRAPPSDQAVLAWRTAIEDFEYGYPAYAAILTLGLCDADGQELPFEARNFFLWLIGRLMENKKRRGLPRREVRVLFKIHCRAERMKKRSNKGQKLPMPVTVMDYLKEMYGCSDSAIEEIVKPRRSRPPRKMFSVSGEPE